MKISIVPSCSTNELIFSTHRNSVEHRQNLSKRNYWYNELDDFCVLNLSKESVFNDFLRYIGVSRRAYCQRVKTNPLLRDVESCFYHRLSNKYMAEIKADNLSSFESKAYTLKYFKLRNKIKQLESNYV